jgi:hypothetical protein
MAGWPFKTLKQNSSWPLQGVVIALAAAVLQADTAPAAVAKTIERALRVGVRLANEFGVTPAQTHALLDHAYAVEGEAAAVPAPLFGGGTDKLSA